MSKLNIKVKDTMGDIYHFFAFYVVYLVQKLDLNLLSIEIVFPLMCQDKVFIIITIF